MEGLLSLSERLRQRILREGPISFRDFMEAALYDPDEGYYAKGARIGEGGDFVTSPHVTPAFAAALARKFRRDTQGFEGTVDFVEAGAGDGRFLKDFARALAEEDPDFSRRLRAPSEARARSRPRFPRRVRLRPPGAGALPRRRAAPRDDRRPFSRFPPGRPSGGSGRGGPDGARQLGRPDTRRGGGRARDAGDRAPGPFPRGSGPLRLRRQRRREVARLPDRGPGRDGRPGERARPDARSLESGDRVIP